MEQEMEMAISEIPMELAIGGEADLKMPGAVCVPIWGAAPAS